MPTRGIVPGESSSPKDAVEALLDSDRVVDLVELERLENTSAVARGDVGFLLSDFISFSLPLTRVPSGVERWERTNRGRLMRIRAGEVRDPKTGEFHFQIPYGKYARAILLGLCTEAKRTGDPVVELGSSMREYASRLGFEVGGRQAGLLLVQVQAVAGMQMEVRSSVETEDYLRDDRYSALVSSEAHLYFGKHDPVGQDSLLPSTVRLADDLMRALTGHSVPIDEGRWRYINKRSKSPLALDIYTWLSYRLHKCPKVGARVTWDSLADQFGSQADRKQFTRSFKEALPLVLEAYPAADGNVEVVRGGLILHYAAAPVEGPTLEPGAK